MRANLVISALEDSMQLWRTTLCCLLFCLVAGFCFEAYAASLASNTACVAAGKFQNAITPLAMYCVKYAIGIAIEIYFEGLKFYLMPIIYAMIVLSLVIFGVKLMSAQIQDITKETMTLLLKIGLVLYFVTQWREYYPSFFGAIDYLSGIFVGVITKTSPIAGCDTSGLSAGMPALNPFGDAARDQTVSSIVGSGESYELWFRFDCLVGRLLGAGDPLKYAFSVSMVAVIGAAIFTGPFGLMLFFVGSAAIIAVFFVVMRSVLTVMIAYMSLAFAIILAPIFIPLALFKETSSSYFLKWVSIIVTSIIQPVFIMGFLVFALLLFNDLLYEDSKIPPESGIVPLNKAMGMTRDSTVDSAWKAGSGSVTGNYETTKIKTVLMPADKKFNKPLGENKGGKPTSGSINCKSNFGACSGWDLAAFASFGTLNFMDEFNKFKALIMNMLAMLFLSYIVLKLLYDIPDIASSIAGTAALGLVKAASVPLALDSRVAGFMKRAYGIAMGGTRGGGKQLLEGMQAAKGGGVPMGQGKMAMLKGMAANSVKTQGAMSGKSGLIMGAVRGGAKGFMKGGVSGALTGMVRGGVSGAAGNVKDLVSKGGAGVSIGAVRTLKDAVKRDEGNG